MYLISDKLKLKLRDFCMGLTYSLALKTIACKYSTVYPAGVGGIKTNFLLFFSCCSSSNPPAIRLMFHAKAHLMELIQFFVLTPPTLISPFIDRSEPSLA